MPVSEHLVPGQLYSSGRLWSLWDFDLDSTSRDWGQLWKVTPGLVPARGICMLCAAMCSLPSWTPPSLQAILSMVNYSPEASLQLLPSDQHVQ